ncbi:MAG TPA: class I SAM-dependent methyltransferase [Actinomycetota bacterium]
MTLRDQLGGGVFALVRRIWQKKVVGPIKYRSPTGYDAARFWNDRYRRHGATLQGSGQERLSEEENRAAYVRFARTLVEYVRRAGADLGSARVLDIGCGQGFYAQVLADQGVTDYTGLDIADVLFDELRERFPGFRFFQNDISQDPVDGTYDLIIMIDMIEHLVTSEALLAAMKTVRSAMAPEGLLLIGPLPERPTRELFYIHFWTIEEVRQRLPDLDMLRPDPFRTGHLVGFRDRSA